MESRPLFAKDAAQLDFAIADKAIKWSADRFVMILCFSTWMIWMVAVCYPDTDSNTHTRSMTQTVDRSFPVIQLVNEDVMCEIFFIMCHYMSFCQSVYLSSCLVLLWLNNIRCKHLRWSSTGPVTVSLHYGYDGAHDRWKARSKIALVFPNGRLCQIKYSVMHSIFIFPNTFQVRKNESWRNMGGCGVSKWVWVELDINILL